MGLNAGDITASSGMSKAIYDKINEYMSPPLEENMSSDNMKKIRDSWKELAYAIAQGVINHIKSNMVIQGVTTSGNVSTSVDGYTELNTLGGHKHEVDLSGTENNVIFTQNNDGTGLVD
jgi:hypothetical protein